MGEVDFVSVFLGFSVWLTVLFVGFVVWVIRQIVPTKIQKKKAWKLLVRLLPPLFGGAISAIPQLQHVDGNIVQSVMVGVLCGSVSSTVYEVFRATMSERMKLALGSKLEKENAK